MGDRDLDRGLELAAQLDALLGGEIQRQGLIQPRNTGKIQRFTASEDEKTVRGREDDADGSREEGRLLEPGKQHSWLLRTTIARALKTMF